MNISQIWHTRVCFLQESSFMEPTAKDGTVQGQESVWSASVVERQSNWMCTSTGHLGCHAPFKKER